MQFTFTAEQDQFRDIVQRFLRDKSPPVEVRRLMATSSGYDPDVWRQLSDELGLPAIAIPEEYGGAGFGMVELGIVMEELGRSLLCAPYFSSGVLATTAILNVCSDEEKARLLPDLASGSRRATLALTEPAGGWEIGDIETACSETPQGHVLNGTKSYVLDGHTADLVIVAARTTGSRGEDGIRLFAVDGERVERTVLESMDPTRKIAQLSFSETPATPLGRPELAVPALRATLDIAAVGLANEMAGGAQALLESAVSYAKMRVQFGRTIGSFQAIKHKCADMLLDVESAKSAAYCAAQAAADNDPELPALASLAKAAASDTYMRTAASAIQIHGGIGFTWENDTHLWFKRAKSSEVLLGDAAYHRELMMRRWEA